MDNHRIDVRVAFWFHATFPDEKKWFLDNHKYFLNTLSFIENLVFAFVHYSGYSEKMKIN